MPGRGGGAWPHVPSSRATHADPDTGIGGRSERHGSQSSFDDLGVDAGDGPDPGNPSESRTPPRAVAPAQQSSGANGTSRPTAKPGVKEARFGRGARVKHLDYGSGTVIASSVLGSEELVLVRFDSRPDKPKNLSLSIHRLEPA